MLTKMNPRIPLHVEVLRFSDGPHTRPAEARLVQYASDTAKCPGTTESGLSGKQATHDGARPAHYVINARPKEWRNTFR